MYKIIKQGDSFSVFEIQEGFKSDLIRQKTYEEWEKEMYGHKPNTFFQETLPVHPETGVGLSSIYWKVLDNKVVAMDIEEINTISTNITNNEINTTYYGFRHHLEVYDLTTLLILVPNLIARLEEIKSASESGSGLAKYISERVQNPDTLKFRTRINLFIDNIEIDGMDQLLAIPHLGDSGEQLMLVTKHTDNPVWTLFRPQQVQPQE